MSDDNNAITGEIVRRYSFADHERFDGYGDDYIHTELFGFCGCGRPDDSLQHIVTVLRGIKARREGPAANYEAEERQREADAGNANAYAFTLYWLDKEGYAEHGGSVYSCWLTPKGETLLDDLELLFADDTDNPTGLG
jgi:hypothetical protein